MQYYGWALKNRAALMPSREQVEQAVRQVEQLRAKHHGRIVIDAVVPDYYARFPKPCVGGWGRRSLNVTPAGRVLPCHAAEVIPGLEFWNVREHSLADIWRSSPAFMAFRGTDWMQEPCKSCERREQDFGGCRCQAFLIAGDARAADPVCHLSPHHALVEQLAAVREEVPTATGIPDSGSATRKIARHPDCHPRVKWWRLGGDGGALRGRSRSDPAGQAPPHQGGLR